MDQGKNMIIILVFTFILFYASKIVFKNNYFHIKFIKVWLTFKPIGTIVNKKLKN